MADSIASQVRSECRALTRHLIDADPSDYIVQRYARGLETDTFREGLVRYDVDGVLDGFGRTGRLGVSLADTYARFFAPAGSFRRRAVLLGAILESSPGTCEAFEPPPAGRGRAWLVLVASGLLFALRLGTAIIVVGPFHLVARVAGRRSAAAPDGPTSP